MALRGRDILAEKLRCIENCRAAGLRTGDGAEGVTAFTAGDVTIRREGGRETAALLEQAERLMAPYVVDGGFFVQGVRG